MIHAMTVFLHSNLILTMHSAYFKAVFVKIPCVKKNWQNQKVKTAALCCVRGLLRCQGTSKAGSRQRPVYSLQDAYQGKVAAGNRNGDIDS